MVGLTEPVPLFTFRHPRTQEAKPLRTLLKPDTLLLPQAWKTLLSGMTQHGQRLEDVFMKQWACWDKGSDIYAIPVVEPVALLILERKWVSIFLLARWEVTVAAC